MPDPRPGRPALEFAFLLLQFLLLSLLAGPLPAAAELSRTALPPNLGYWYPLTSVHDDAVLVPDGIGGVFVICTEQDSRLWVQHLDAQLAVVHGWPPGGRVVGSAEEWITHHDPVIAPDGEGGVYVAWVEDDSYPTLRVLRLGGNGAPVEGWPASGVPISAQQLRSTFAGDIIGPVDFVQVTFPAIARTDQGVVVAWMCAASCCKQFRIQKLDGRGGLAPGWPEGGVVLTESSLDAEGPWFNTIVEVASDDRGGAFALWSEARDRLSHVKLVRVWRNGVVERRGDWMLAGEATLYGTTMEQDHPSLTSNGRGEPFVIWTSEGRGRRPVNLAEAIVFDGQSSSLTATRSLLDPWWLQKGPRVVADGWGGAYVGWSDPTPRAEIGRLTRLVPGNRSARGWPEAGIALGAVARWLFPDRQGVLAVSDDGTNLIAQRFDESGRIATGWPRSGLVITADAGKSYCRASRDGNGGLFLAWGEPRADGMFDLIAAHWSPEPLGSRPLPLVFAVHEPHPNPTARPFRIEFDLPSPEHVDVDVFDVAGRRVVRLCDQRPFEAGGQSVDWNLEARSGHRVGPGLYFIRVKAGRDQRTTRVAVVE